PRPPPPTLLPYTTLFRSPPPSRGQDRRRTDANAVAPRAHDIAAAGFSNRPNTDPNLAGNREWGREIAERMIDSDLGLDLVRSHRSEEHTSELQSRFDLVC